MFRKLLFLCFFSLSGCASITTGSNQSISINTYPETGALCELTNDKGRWFLNSTPGALVVHRSYSDLNVICTKGTKIGNIIIKSTTKAMAFGNVLMGGIIGGAADVATGAAYDYPADISVQIK